MDKRKTFPLWFLVPSLLVFTVIFIIPTLTSFFFSMTVWDFHSTRFVGLDNFKLFFTEPSLFIGISNTFIYAIVTSGLKVIIAFFLAIFLTSSIRSKNILRSVVFFPTLVSTIAVGIAFTALMHPTKGLINTALIQIGLPKVSWLTDPNLAIFSVALVDVWKGLGIATVIYIAGIQSIDKT